MEKLFLVYGRTGFYDVGNWGTEDFDEAKPLGIFDNFGEAMDRFRESVREAWNCLKEDCFYTPDDPLYKTTEDDLFVDWNTDKDDYDEMELCWKHFESDNYAEWKVTIPFPGTETVVMPFVCVKKMTLGK